MVLLLHVAEDIPQVFRHQGSGTRGINQVLFWGLRLTVASAVNKALGGDCLVDHQTYIVKRTDHTTVVQCDTTDTISTVLDVLAQILCREVDLHVLQDVQRSVQREVVLAVVRVALHGLDVVVGIAETEITPVASLRQCNVILLVETCPEE